MCGGEKERNREICLLTITMPTAIRGHSILLSRPHTMTTSRGTAVNTMTVNDILTLDLLSSAAECMCKYVGKRDTLMFTTESDAINYKDI